MRAWAGVLPAGIAAAAVALQGGGATGQESSRAAAPVYGYEIVSVYPHDPRAFTQGLVYRDGFLFESTGLTGQSTLRKVRLETGEVLQQRSLARRYFGEGLAVWNDRLLQLTWDTNVGFVYDLTSFDIVRTFRYAGEGWGLTHDGRRLVMSDGTATLRFLDPDTFAETGRVSVTEGGRRVDKLNELEFIEGRVYANVWQTDRIAIIDPASGQVTAWADLAGLSPHTVSSADAVLNGIAYDAKNGRLFVTGKLWPSVFEIRLRPRP